jgi:hypothetical protein
MRQHARQSVELKGDLIGGTESIRTSAGNSRRSADAFVNRFNW